MRLRRFRADLHIHSCLSPCGELTSSPRAIVERALSCGLDIIAVADHNTAENAAAAIRAAEGKALTVLPGMEITSEEEVHVLAVFERMEDIWPVENEVARNLPAVRAKKRFIRDQVIVSEDDDVIGFSHRCLLAATRLDVYEIIALIHRERGLAIAAHVDKKAFSVVSQLGFIPGDAGFDALEFTRFASPAKIRALTSGERPPPPFVRFSDAHRPGEIGRTFTEFLLPAATFKEIRRALRSGDRRRVRLP
jgi:PHP family Zn ribbon phosphoesterase